MLSGLYSAATGIQLAELRQQVIAENLAHLDVPGYRAQYLAAELLEVADETFDGELGVQPQDIARDFSIGQLKQSGRSLDTALGGPGFFALETPEGPAYTRSGVFHIDPDGTLVSSAGYAVLAKGGTIQVPRDVSADNLTITREGFVVAGSIPLGQLEVVDFPDPSVLEAVGAALFRPPPGLEPETVTVPDVQQGYRELSNVSATSELINMLVGVRYHEAAQRALTTIDEAVSDHIEAEGG